MPEYFLISLVLKDLDLEYSVVEAWALAGASGVTSFNSDGIKINQDAFTMDDVPLFPSLSTLLDARRTDQKVIITVVEGKEAMQKLLDLTIETVGDLAESGKGILYVQQLAVVIGLKKPEA